MFPLLFSPTGEWNSLDMSGRVVVPTSNFSCSYCNLLWTLVCSRLYPMKTIRSRQFCTICALAISKQIVLPNQGPPKPLPWQWPYQTYLIAEAYCCYCRTKRCCNSVKLSQCQKGLIVVHQYSEEHFICVKCLPTFVLDFVRDRAWRCNCERPNYE